MVSTRRLAMIRVKATLTSGFSWMSLKKTSPDGFVVDGLRNVERDIQKRERHRRDEQKVQLLRLAVAQDVFENSVFQYPFSLIAPASSFRGF
jgi:hypothetical protein